MTRLAAFAALLLSIASLAPPPAAAVDDADRGAIREVIEAQIAAFGRDDAAAAFALAAPGIQAKFGDAEAFAAMVRAAYGPVYRPAEVSFRALDESGALPVQHVLIVDADGAAWLARYPMQRQADGRWRIAGCVLAPWDGARAALSPAAARTETL